MRRLFSVMEGRRSEDWGFSMCAGSSIDGQRCHAVSLVEHGGGWVGEYGDFGDAVSGEQFLQGSISGAAEGARSQPRERCNVAGCGAE